MPARMPTLEEIAHWTIEDINGQVLGLLPKGWTFDLETRPNDWRAVIKAPDPEREIWALEHWELRILMLSAFAWLWQQRNPTRVHPAWVPRPAPRLTPVRPGAIGVSNPVDLDPAHIRSVYDAHARKRGKE